MRHGTREREGETERDMSEKIPHDQFLSELRISFEGSTIDSVLNQFSDTEGLNASGPIRKKKVGFDLHCVLGSYLGNSSARTGS